MRFKNSFAAAVAAAVSAVVFSAAFQPAEASFIFYAEQVGPNVVITGTGSFITSGSGALPLAGPNLNWGYLAKVSNDNMTAGPNPPAINSNLYAPIAGSMSNLATITGTTEYLPSSTSGGHVYWSTSSTALVLPASLGSGVPFGNSSTYSGRTLADFGWTAGTYASPVVNRSYTLTNGETIQILGVPEPTHMVSVAGIGAAYGAWRLRKLRRSRTAAGEAIAS
jgi:hypothetical protein